MKIKPALKRIIIILFLPLSLLWSQDQNTSRARIVVNADLGEEKISRHIYGHFSEHLGHCIYDGYWVGEDATVPNTRGIRKDVVEALINSSIPNLRWPGGCFADEYHWMDGIGPGETRPKMVNTHWGGVTEDNSFGTHEFLDLCEQLGTEPYICGNVGSGSVEEMADWVEYINFDGTSPMADLRRSNGRDQAWGITYWGVGNENWGCGGNMRPEFYADQYRRYATYCRNYGDHRLKKIAGGSHDGNLHWTEVMMKEIPHHMMWGLSLHHYMTDWSNKGSATDFGLEEYWKTMDMALNFGKLLDGHIRVMDRYDPEGRVALVVDEWGTWWDVEPGTNPGFLYQQNTMRDAFVAAISLNHFNKRCKRIKMANLAQTVNVLQAMVLTREEKMVLTPTYHVFEMFKVHQDAVLLPLSVESDLRCGPGSQELAALNVSGSRDEQGKVHLTLVNIHPEEALDMLLDIRGMQVSEVSGRILTSDRISDHNTFDDPERVQPEVFKGFRMASEGIRLKLPAKSVLVLEIDQ
jgi:alpha-N-arabinofuranosidase